MSVYSKSQILINKQGQKQQQSDFDKKKYPIQDSFIIKVHLCTHLLTVSSTLLASFGS